MKRISHTNHSLLRSIIAAVLALGCFVSPLLAASAFADGWYCPSCGRNDDGYFCPKDGIRKPSGLDSTSVGGVSKYDAKDLDAVYAPVDLTSLTPYFEGVIDAFTDGIKDTMGNTYRTGIRGYMSSSDGSRFDCFHIWDIGCQYNTLTATGIICENDKGSRCEGCYRIYGDGILLYEKNNIGSTTKPYSIEVDITGVTDLKIEMYGEGNMGTGGMDSVLVDVMLHKK